MFFLQVTSSSICINLKPNVDIYEILYKCGINSNLIDKIDRSGSNYYVYLVTTDLDFYKLARDLYKTRLCHYAIPNFLMDIELCDSAL